MLRIIQCPSCDGYGWVDDDTVAYCDWCGGVGYVYQADDGTQRRIPPADFAAVADELEQLEAARLRGLGYTGSARKPWEQAIRQQRDDTDAEADDDGEQ